MFLHCQLLIYLIKLFAHYYMFIRRIYILVFKLYILFKKNYTKHKGFTSHDYPHIIINNNIIKLVWEPSVVKVTKSYSRRLPALERFYRETNFSPLKLTHST